LDQEKILNNLKDGVIKYDEEKVISNSEKVIETGIDINEAILNGLSKGMRIVGDLYEDETYSIPEVLLCADALEAGMNILKPHLKKEKRKEGHVVCIGTVEGDIHSIGKNIVKLMFEVGGFKVIDLGENIESKKIIDILSKENIDVVALSTMMTPTLRNMKDTIDEIRNKFKKVKIMVGGASVSEKTAKLFNADGFAKNAQGALKVLESIVNNNLKEDDDSI